MWFLSSALDLNESQLNHSLGKLLKFFCPPPLFFSEKGAGMFIFNIYLFVLSCGTQDL